MLFVCFFLFFLQSQTPFYSSWVAMASDPDQKKSKGDLFVMRHKESGEMFL